jgi:uncharacterized RDD family membrane protein YckC
MSNPGSYPPPPGDEPPPYGAPPPPYGAPPPGYGYAPPPGNAVGQPGNLTDRFLARLIDGVIIGVAAVILNIVLGFISNSWLIGGFISAVLTAVLYLGYFAYFESTRGQTIGKQALKLKVVGPGHAGNPTLEQAIRRNIYMGFSIAGVVPIIGSLIGGLATLAAVILIAVNINSDPQRQHWFDKFAGGTQVLKIG